MNVIAGLMIGFVNEVWFTRLLAPFLWGVVFCVYTWIIRQDRFNTFLTNAEKRGRESKWGMSHKAAFYFIEYLTALTTSMAFSLVGGLIRGFIK